LPELITIVAYLDSPEFIDQFMNLSEEEETDNEQVERIFKRFLRDE
jgi:hypothetical protein